MSILLLENKRHTNVVLMFVCMDIILTRVTIAMFQAYQNLGHWDWGFGKTASAYVKIIGRIFLVRSTITCVHYVKPLDLHM